MQNYASLQETHEQDDELGGPVVHVAEPSRARWNHVEDLDSFFTRMYQYHQGNGFFCIGYREASQLFKFLVVVFLTSYIFHGIEYPILFKEVPLPNNGTKVRFSDFLYGPRDVLSHFNGYSWTLFCIAATVWTLKLIRGVYQQFHFWDIKQFYNTALKVDDLNLENHTWTHVQTKVIHAQTEQEMCIHKSSLTELDIHHRIMRQENYFIALVYKKLLPARFNMPFLGEVVYWTPGLRFNMQLLLFWSPWGPFEQSWKLRDDYKNKKLDLPREFAKQTRILAAINFFLAPLIFFWQILNAFFSNVAIIRREPSMLAIRRWSPYGRLYMRHFNELDHELQARLTRAHRPATRYLGAFSTPLSIIICELILFTAGAFLSVMVVLTVWDEDVVTAENVLGTMTGLGLLVAITVSAIPDETTSQDLEDLLARVMYEAHYMPPEWAGQAHTPRVRKDMEQLFQYRFVTLLETVLSPIVTPFVLWFYVAPRAQQFVDFFQAYTVFVDGVGDVCTFAVLDLDKFKPNNQTSAKQAPATTDATKKDDDEPPKEAGKEKLVMSLLHFKSTNPSWQPPASMQAFVKDVQNHTSMITSLSNEDRPMGESSLMSPFWRTGEPRTFHPASHADGSVYNANVWRTVGPTPAEEPPRLSLTRMNGSVTENSIREMTLNATYLHSQNMSRADSRKGPPQETTPLLIEHR